MQKCLWTLIVVLAAGSAFFLGQSNAIAAPDALDGKGEQAKQIIERLRSVMRDITTLRYDGESRVQMPDGKRIALSKTKVTTERMDNANWKLLVQGTFEYEPVDPKSTAKRDNPVNINAAYDGTICAGLQEKRKVLRKTAPRDFDAVRLDINQLEAAGSVCWELLANPPFASFDSASKVEHEGVEKIGDQDCDVFWVIPTAGKPAPVPYRVYFAQRDGLPRRLELFRPATARLARDKRGEPGIVQNYNNIVGTPDPAGVDFQVALPKGWTVAADKNIPADAGPVPASDNTPPPTKPAEVKALNPKHPLLPSESQLVSPGSNAPAFKLKDTDGKERSLEEFKGKVVVLHFWGSWYPNSVEVFPVLQRTLDRYSDKGVVVLGMNFEQNAKVDPLKFMKDKKATYPTLVDAESMAGLYKVGGWSTFYVIGKDGKVVWAANGLASPPGGTNKQEEKLQYLEENLGQAVEKALK
ncbi:MAG: TlpA family protein disulfide reductase [Planctomycetes bacterium]|nr:TlpA family protein disulfide reductase [Planctomycetota bacterium]